MSIRNLCVVVIAGSLLSRLFAGDDFNLNQYSIVPVTPHTFSTAGSLIHSNGTVYQRVTPGQLLPNDYCMVFANGNPLIASLCNLKRLLRHDASLGMLLTEDDYNFSPFAPNTIRVGMLVAMVKGDAFQVVRVLGVYADTIKAGSESDRHLQARGYVAFEQLRHFTKK